MMDEIKFAIEHLIKESGYQNIEKSLRIGYKNLSKAHDAIHEFMFIAPLCFPTVNDNNIGWEQNSAFLLYQLEVFNQAHRSLFEALSGFYNVAFILLRTTLETLLKGAFWECLSDKRFREDASVISSSKHKRLREFISDIPLDVSNKLDSNSAAIFDLTEQIIEDSSFRPSMTTIINQLHKWGMLIPITDAYSVIYEELYSGLSADVHVVPDRIDVGRRIRSEAPHLFDQHIDLSILHEYAETLQKVIDVAIVVELNILQYLPARYESVRLKLSERLTEMEKLGLKHSYKRVFELAKKAA